MLRSIYPSSMIALGAFEFINAIMALASPIDILPTMLFVGADTPAEDIHVTRNLMRCWAFVLIGLGTTRIAAGVNPSSKVTWLMNLLLHLFEMFFWWAEALEPNTMTKIFSMQNYTPDPSIPDYQNILISLVNVNVNSDPLIFVLLLVVPGLVGFILLNFPNDDSSPSKTTNREKKRAKRN
ncbi:hypothetical protein TrRE_jg13413 [Triparma retinervis]|uniref:Uncharacterized protein n=1 Tax=Triparma retinervis TaxID=2557542 RepID=A0A9W7DX98_9STRA|nr:hypothetical protein TrRE_jg13413 [Triparma retinervis]